MFRDFISLSTNTSYALTKSLPLSSYLSALRCDLAILHGQLIIEQDWASSRWSWSLGTWYLANRLGRLH